MAGIDVTFALEQWDIFQNPDAFVPKLKNLALGGAVRRIKGEIQRATPVDTADLKQSWQWEIGDDFISYYTDVDYADFLEEGKYPRVGPRTKRGPDGKIYSSQAVGGILGPLEADEDWTNQIMNSLIDDIVSNLEIQ